MICLSLIPPPPELPGFHGVDKLVHLFVYAFIMLWFGLCYSSGRAYRNLGIGLVIMGILLELIQGKTGYRSMSYMDMTANGLSVLIGWLIARTRLFFALVRIESRMGEVLNL